MKTIARNTEQNELSLHKICRKYADMTYIYMNNHYYKANTSAH